MAAAATSAAPAAAMPPTLPSGTLIKRRFRIMETLGRGAFGEIYRAVDMKRTAGSDDSAERELDDPPRPVAIKVEAHLRPEPGKEQRRLLGMELAVLKRMPGLPYACRYYATGKFSISHPSGDPTLSVPHEYVVMELLGPSLSKLRRVLGRPSTIPPDHPALAPPGLPPSYPDLTSRMPFPPKLAAHLALHMLRGIEMCHTNAGVVHRDVKPGNFCVTREFFETDLAAGRGWIGVLGSASTQHLRAPAHTLHPSVAALRRLSDSALGSSLSLSSSAPSLSTPNPPIPPLKIIDFGLARPYIDLTTGQPRPARSRAGFRGTAAYASPACHAGRDLGRVDDLWSWFYCLIEMMAGWLPWKGLAKLECAAHKDWHHAHPEVFLCADVECPPEMRVLFEYISGLEFADEPDYERIARWCEDMAAWERPVVASLGTRTPAAVASRIEGGWSIESSSGLSDADLDGMDDPGVDWRPVRDRDDNARTVAGTSAARVGSTCEIEMGGEGTSDPRGGRGRTRSTALASSATSILVPPPADTHPVPATTPAPTPADDTPEKSPPRVRRRSSVRFSDIVEVFNDPPATSRPTTSAPATPSRSAVAAGSGTPGSQRRDGGLLRGSGVAARLGDSAKRLSVTSLPGLPSWETAGVAEAPWDGDVVAPVIRGSKSASASRSAAGVGRTRDTPSGSNTPEPHSGFNTPEMPTFSVPRDTSSPISRQSLSASAPASTFHQLGDPSASSNILTLTSSATLVGGGSLVEERQRESGKEEEEGGGVSDRKKYGWKEELDVEAAAPPAGALGLRPRPPLTPSPGRTFVRSYVVSPHGLLTALHSRTRGGRHTGSDIPGPPRPKSMSAP